jgi:putative transcriptional regulator
MSAGSANNSLAPTLLLSMPQLTDPNFKRSVVLLCEHGSDGAFGLVVNRPTGSSASEAVRLDPPIRRRNDLPLFAGGPVDPQRGWLLLSEPPSDADSLRLSDGLYLSSSPNVLRRLLETTPAPRARIFTGYAGWGPGQLDAEIAASAWLIAEIEVDLIFDVKPEEMWETAIRRLGADPSSLQMGQGVH